MYDLEQFLKDAGAEKINEKAVRSLGRELQDTVRELVEEASMYANYAGRKKLINANDIELANHDNIKRKPTIRYKGRLLKPKQKSNMAKKSAMRIRAPQIMLINNIPVIKEEPDISLQSQG